MVYKNDLADRASTLDHSLTLHYSMVSLLSSILGTLLIGSSWIFAIASSDPAAENFYYSENIFEATNKFISACNYANGSREVIDHPQLGAQGEKLQVVVCALGDPAARSVVFSISGTHGIEGYAGSMAQISMLRGPPSMLPRGIRIVHVHMLNPYGASHILKENEDNADQLKNSAGYYSLNYDNPILQRLMDGIDWPNLGNSTTQQNTIGFFMQLVGEYGEEKVNLALKTGQGKRPRGIAYFGPYKSWSTNTTEYVVTKYLRDVDDILLIDWHTAVGPYGEWSFVPENPESETAFKRWLPQAPTVPFDVGTPAGGRLPYSWVKTMTNAKRLITGLWEAGTYNVTLEINAAFLLRLYCRFYSSPADPFCEEIIKQTRNFFYPYAADWKNQTYHRINDYLPKVLAGFAAEANHAAAPMLSVLSIMVGIIICFLS